MTTIKINLDEIYHHCNIILDDFLKHRKDLEDFLNLTEKIFALIQSDFDFNELSDDGELATHLVNVAAYGGKIAEYCNLSEIEVKKLILGGLLHDIGKSCIPDYILNKSGPLNITEKLIIEKHPDFGKLILSHLSIDADVLAIVEHYHNYIKTLPKPIILINVVGDYTDAFPLICSVGDIIDAVLSVRPYKKRQSPKVARETIFSLGILDIDAILLHIGLNEVNCN